MSNYHYYFFRKSVDLCQQIEAAGVSFITVHGRTTFQKNEPIDQECIKLINESVNIPVILNGDVKSLSDAITMQEYTGCQGNDTINYLVSEIFTYLLCLGIMSARGILHNPGLFAGHQVTPISAVQEWLNIHHTNFLWFHHHLVFMCEHLIPKNERNKFNKLRNASDVVSFLENQFHIPSVLPSNRVVSKEISETSGVYYKENVVEKKTNSSQLEDVVDSLTNLFN